MINKILFATDLGPYTPMALVYVESLARKFDASIHLVHAIPPISEFTDAVVKSYCSDSVKRELLQTGNIKGILESVRDEVFDMVTSNQLLEENVFNRLEDVIILPGKPAPLILSESERLNADLIVIGTHGPESMAEGMLGSVCTKILQLAKVPVFLVPMLNASKSIQKPSNFQNRAS